MGPCHASSLCLMGTVKPMAGAGSSQQLCGPDPSLQKGSGVTTGETLPRGAPIAVPGSPAGAAAERQLHHMVASGPAGSTPSCVTAPELLSTAHLILLPGMPARPTPSLLQPSRFPALAVEPCVQQRAGPS